MPASRWHSEGRAPGGPPTAIDPAQHLAWARGIARGVRADYGFLRGSQEELELEATALLVACECAARFDPALSWRVGTERAVQHALRALKRRPIIIAQPQWAEVWFGGADYGGWVIGVAAGEAGRLRRRSPLRRAMVRTALAVARHRAATFDPAGAFRGWAAVAVRGECRREAVRLRNAGVFRTCADLGWDWQAGGLPGAEDDEDGREPDQPRQLVTADAEVDEDAEWYEIWLRWCLAMVRGGRTKRPPG